MSALAEAIGIEQSPLHLAQERQSHELIQALPAAIYTTDAAGRITFFNEAAAELWGHRPEIGKSEWCGSWRLLWPDGRVMPHDECPMAVALKEGRAIRGAEAIAERPDGTRIPFFAYPTPLRNESGALVGAINMLVDVSRHKQVEADSLQLSAIVESTDDAIVSKDINGIIASWNRGAERLFGYKAEEVVGSSITLLVPEDRHDEEFDILERLNRGESIEHYETVRRRKDGSLVEVSLTVTPLRDATGRVVGASKIARDITERNQARERLRLLLREMNHRVKNLFALAGGVVALSASSARTAKELAETVRARLGALSRAHDLTLSMSDDEQGIARHPTTLPLLVRTIVAPYLDPEPGENVRIVAAGPEVPVSGGAVTSLALLLHELTTNAAKYGALSSPSGRIDIGWLVENDGLRLTWRERGGPAIDRQPKEEGFGSLLARATVSGQLGGQMSREWKPDGLVAVLQAPLARLAG
ncbi:MAG: sensor histidine kinase [Kiloniellales bacterium]